MRILQVGKYYPPVKGGMETALRHICESLLARGHDVHALTAGGGLRSREEPLVGRDDSARGVLVRAATWGTWNSQPLTLSLPDLLARELRDFRPDVVHLHLPNPVACWAWRAAVRRGTLPRPPLAVWYHADITRQRFTRRLIAPIVRGCLAQADGISVSTGHLRETSNVLAPWRAKVRVIPFGIETAPWFTLPVGGDGPFLFVGRLVRYKGLTTLIDAVGAVPGAELVIAGAGTLGAALAGQIARAGWSARIRLLGEVPDAELPHLMQRCRAVVLPSLDRSETFGLVLLEAMAAGLPVVTSQLDTGVLEVNEDGVTGWSCPPGDVGALAAVLAAILADPEEARRRGAKGRGRVQERFDRRRLAVDLETWYGALRPA